MCKKRGKGRIFKKGGEESTSRLFINFDFFSFFCFTTQSEPDLYSSSTICSLLSLECQGEWKRCGKREKERKIFLRARRTSQNWTLQFYLRKQNETLMEGHKIRRNLRECFFCTIAGIRDLRMHQRMIKGFRFFSQKLRLFSLIYHN